MAIKWGGTSFAGDLVDGKRIYFRDQVNDVTYVTGTTVPTDWSSWFAKACIFIDTNVSAGTSWMYENIWTRTSSTFAILSGGGWGTPSWWLDDAYSIDQSVLMDNGATTWTDSTTGALNMFVLVKDGAGSGNMLDFNVDAALTGAAINLDMNLGIAAPAIIIDNGATARTGDDIRITDNSTGNHSIINLNKTWSGASIGLDYQETYNGSSASFVVKATLDNADGIDTTILQAVRWTGVRTAPVIDINDASTGSAHIIDIDLTGVYTGNVFDFASGAAATGNVFFLNMDTAVAMTALHIEGSWVRTQPFIELITDSTSSASLIDISVDGAITGQAAIDIDMNAGLAANAIYIDAGAGTRTANLLEFKDDWDGNVDTIAIVASNTWSGSVIDIDVTGIRTGNIIDIVMSGAATSTAVIAIDMDAAVAAAAIFIDAGNATRTSDVIDVTFDGDGDISFLDLNCTNTGSGDLIDIDVTGVHTGNAIDIEYSSAASTGNAIELVMWTNLAGSAMRVTAAGSRTDDLFQIIDSSTSNAPIYDIDITGNSTGVFMDVTCSGSKVAGHIFDIDTGTNIAGNAILITTAGARTAPLINIVGAGTDAGTDDHTIFVTQSATQDSNIMQFTYDTAASTGNAVALAMGTNVAGMAISITSAATGVSGEWAGMNMAHTGNLTAGADLMRLDSTGSLSSTSNVLSLVQRSGACTTGANALHISATGANCEAIKVDDWKVVFDETLEVTGLITATAWVTGKIIFAGITSDTGAHAIPVTGAVHEVTTSGAGDALTLANGTAGQRLCVVYVAEGGGADTAVITPTTLAGGATITLNALGDSCDLVYSSTGGRYVLGLGGTAAVA